MPEAVNRYRFCGLPTGVNMLPRFAAMVMSVATKHIHPPCPRDAKTTKASGTNAMSATSLVTAMLAKNASPTNTPATARCVRARDQPRPRGIQHAERAGIPPPPPSGRTAAPTYANQRMRHTRRRRHKGARRQGCRNSNDYHGLTAPQSPNRAHNRLKRYVFHFNHEIKD